MSQLHLIVNQAAKKQSDNDQRLVGEKAFITTELESSGYAEILADLKEQGFESWTVDNPINGHARVCTSIYKGGASFMLECKRGNDTTNYEVTRSDIGGCRKRTPTITEAWAPQAFSVKSMEEVKEHLGEWLHKHDDKFKAADEAKARAEEEARVKRETPGFFRRMFG